MKKSGQVTIFIIIAILIVGIGVLVYVFKDSFSKDTTFMNSNVIAFQNSFQNCFDRVLVKGILFIGVQGGYYYTPKKSLITEYSVIPYGYLGKKTLLSKEEFENQISYYIEDVIFVCLNNQTITYSLTDASKPYAKTSIKNEKISVNLNFPLFFTLDESSFEIEDFNSEINYDLEKIYSFAEDIIENFEKDNNYIDTTYLASLPYEVNILPYGDTIIFSLEDKTNKLGEENFIFNFAYKR